MLSKAWRKSEYNSHTINMRILFDQGTPVPLRDHLKPHTIATAFELGWSKLKNGELLAVAEDNFDLFITTDQHIRYQQSLRGRKLAILVLLTTSWPRIKSHTPEIRKAIDAMKSGDYQEFSLK